MATAMKTTHSIKINEIAKLAHRRMRTTEGQYLFREGMVANNIYLVRSGKVKIGKVTLDGSELELRICGSNDICGELTLFTDHPRYLLNALVMEAGEVAIIEKDVLEREIFQNNRLAYELIKWMSDHFRKTQTKFHDLILMGKKGAFYSTLIRMTNSYGIKLTDGILIDLPLTNQSLGNFCAMSRESTNRYLNELRRKGVISVDNKKITVHDLQYLKDEINCENCPDIYCSIE